MPRELVSLNWEEYDKVVEESERTWALQDNILYDICKRYPGHDCREHVSAKLAIIGRSYGTGIERQIPSDGSQSGSLRKLINHFQAHEPKISKIFQAISDIVEPLNADRLSRILAQHKLFVDVLSTNLCRNPVRSFASKYMHFHCPAVPIYDSLAKFGIRRIRLHGQYSETAISENRDKEYADYVQKFWKVYQEGSKERPGNITVKKLDVYIMSIGEKLRKASR